VTEKEDSFRKLLLATFKVEAHEHLAALAAGLVELETTTSPEHRAEVVERLFREAHSLKGTARSVEMPGIEAICQSVESVFAVLKRQELDPTAALFDLLHRAVDLIGELVAAMEAGGAPPEKPRISELVAELNGAAQGRLPRPPPETGAPEATATPAAPAAPPAAGKEENPPTPALVAAMASGSMRISREKLDALLLKGEGFLAVKQKMAHQCEEFREIGASLVALRKGWTRMRPELRTLRPEGGSANGGAAARRQTAGRKLLDFLQSREDRLADIADSFALMAKGIEQDRRAVETMVDGLLQDLKTVSMLPFSSLLEIMPKMVRDLSRDQGKEAVFTSRGGEIEIDKRILDEMKEPFIHLVRNCIDHGIEKPAERPGRQKPRSGTIAVSVSHWEGKSVEVVVGDDGRGLDSDRIVEAASRLGVQSRQELKEFDQRKISQLIFRSGLTTSPIITDLSGRGLGLSIVRERIEKLGGSVFCETEPGRGTTFRILLPLTMATFRGVLVRLEDRAFLIPTVGLDRTLRVKRGEIKTVENRETVTLDGRTVPFVPLGAVLELPRKVPKESPEYLHLAVLGTGEHRIAFGVDEILNEQEVLVKDLGPQLIRVRNIAGSTVLGSGRMILILNVADLLRSAVGGAATVQVAPAAAPPEGKRSILVVEDSVTSRTLLKNILEVSGYEVETAVDGNEAFATLKTGEFDLVVSDVDMPRLNGFDLTAKIRADAKLAELPVVLVTALESREDRERGIDVGANAYSIKSSFDKSNLLEAIRRLI